MKAQLTIHEEGAPIETISQVEFDAVIARAADEATRANRPNIIFVKVPNGNEVSIVVGERDTVLCFTSGHLNPPYYVSKGQSAAVEPVFTAYVSLSHHTEYPGRNVIPWEDGMRAIHEFTETGELPSAVEWEEV